MKATVTQGNLEAGLRFVLGAMTTKATTYDVLTRVLVSGNAEGLSLAATDLERHAHILLPSEVEGEGSLCVPAREFSQLVGLLPEAPVTLTLSDESMQVACSGTFDLPGVSSERFPRLPALDFSEGWEVERSLLERVSKDVAPMVSHEESRPILKGVLWHQVDDACWFVATDTHRLARLQCESAPKTPALLTPATLDLAAGLGDGPLTVAVQNGSIGFRSKYATVVSRLMAGEYPDYRRVIPKDNDKGLTADTQELRRAVKRALTVSEALSKRVTLSLEADGPLTLSTLSADRGRGSEGIRGAYTGDPLRIGINGGYLADILSRIASDTVRLTFKGPETALLIHDDDADGVLYLMAPLIVQ